MKVEQWGVRVPARQGEEIRQALIREGALDATLKVHRDGEMLVLPVLTPRENAGRYVFASRMGREVLPRHEQVGGIAIMLADDPAGAERILASRPSLHTVVLAKGEVSGEYRTRELTVLAGKPTTRTEVIEHGHHFSVDLAGAYFSARLSTERQRILELTRGSEIILDMFAGVGPFAITLAPKARFVAAADINPVAVRLLLDNVRKNKAVNILPILADARRFGSILPWKFDRIVMNLPLAGTAFLPEAFRLCRRGGTIHFYSLVSANGEHVVRINDLGGVVLSEREVRSYSPGMWHAVYDICVGT